LIMFNAIVGKISVSGGSVDDFNRITFQPEFKQNPNIILWFSGFALPFTGGTEWCTYASPTNITTSGFDVAVGPKDGEPGSQLSVTCLAYSPTRSDVRSGISTTSLQTKDEPVKRVQIEFEGKFTSTPRVFLALSGFSIKSGQDMDIEVQITSLTS